MGWMKDVIQTFQQAVWPKQIKQAHFAALNGGIGTGFVPSSGSVDLGAGIKVQGWQQRAWALWDCVGELHEPTSYIARIVSQRIEFRQVMPGELSAADTEQMLQKALGKTSLQEFVNLLVLNFQVTGEAWVIQNEFGWEVCSVAYPHLKDKIEAARAAGKGAKRFWDPHPNDTECADSSFKSVLDPAEDLLTLSALSRAQSRSRIAQAGILMVPSEQQFEGGDPFGAGLEQAMTTAIRDVQSASALSPVKVQMQAELIEKVRHLTFDRPFDDKVPEKVTQAIHRIALGMAIPADLLEGLGQVNHWSAWAVQEETWKGTLAPLAGKSASVLEWIVEVMGLGTVALEPDPTKLLAKRSTVRDAIDGAKIGAVGLKYVRTALGAGDMDAPTEQDLEIIRTVQSRGTTSDPTVDQTQQAPQNGDPVPIAAGAGVRGSPHRTLKPVPHTRR